VLADWGIGNEAHVYLGRRVKYRRIANSRTDCLCWSKWNARVDAAFPLDNTNTGRAPSLQLGPAWPLSCLPPPFLWNAARRSSISFHLSLASLTDSGGSLVIALLAFSRKNTSMKSVTNLHNIIVSQKTIYAIDYPASIRLLAPDSAPLLIRIRLAHPACPNLSIPWPVKHI
jgi:hypothetical protein